MRKKERPRRGTEKPDADRAREAQEELAPDAPRVTGLAEDEDFDTIFAAGVAQAGESDRPAGAQASPEHSTAAPPAEIDVDYVFSIDPADTIDASEDVKLEGQARRPDEPEPLDEADLLDREPTAAPRRPAR